MSDFNILSLAGSSNIRFKIVRHSSLGINNFYFNGSTPLELRARIGDGRLDDRRVVSELSAAARPRPIFSDRIYRVVIVLGPFFFAGVRLLLLIDRLLDGHDVFRVSTVLVRLGA